MVDVVVMVVVVDVVVVDVFIVDDFFDVVLMTLCC